MANELDVGKALEQLRGKAESKSRRTILDEKNKELDEEIRNLRAERLRLERDNRGLPTRENESGTSGEARQSTSDARRLVPVLLCVLLAASVVALIVWLAG
jgi:hypothetical protein